MAEFNLKVVCEVCGGTGIMNQSGTNLQCTACNGDGYKLYATIGSLEEIDDIQDKVNDCIDKLKDIKEVVDEINKKLG
jgi:DnaJ-class molecular chaperone